MEPQKDSLKNSQTILVNKNGRFLPPKSARSERNLYMSPTLNGISEQNDIKVSYQTTLPRPFPEQNLVAPNYYLHSEVAFSQGFRPEVNYERESAETQMLGETFDTGVNKEHEKENFNVEKEPKKKSSTKRKASNDNESSDNWQDHEIDLLLQYIEDNFDEYRKGNKTKLFNEMSAKTLKNKKPNAIKSKIARMLKTYSDVKKHNEKSGESRKDWVWYEKMDKLFGTRENIAPSFIANRVTDVKDEEFVNSEPKPSKKQKRNNVDTIATAISSMSESRERVWDKKIELEKEKMEKSHIVEMKRLEVEQQKWEYEKEKMKLEQMKFEQMKLEHESKVKEIELRK